MKVKFEDCHGFLMTDLGGKSAPYKRYKITDGIEEYIAEPSPSNGGGFFIDGYEVYKVSDMLSLRFNELSGKVFEVVTVAKTTWERQYED